MTAPYFEAEGVTLYHADNRDVLRGMAAASVDAVVTDPPAGIAFMGREWDKDRGGRDNWVAWMREIAAECLRVLKPGGHALVWALPRTSHWTATAWEDAGFEVRDRIAHLFGSGFPKSLDIGKAIDRAAGMEREVVGKRTDGRYATGFSESATMSAYAARVGGSAGFDPQKVGNITAPATPEAALWDGWGTALKPAVEDWWLLRKPMSERTVAANVLRWGTGAVNVNACRVEWAFDGERDIADRATRGSNGYSGVGLTKHGGNPVTQGRFPANLTHDGSAAVLAGFPEEGRSTKPSGTGRNPGCGPNSWFTNGEDTRAVYQDSGGSAARFYPALGYDDDDLAEMQRWLYCAKADRGDRNEGCEELLPTPQDPTRDPDAPGGNNPRNRGAAGRTNHHPTVKPTALMRWLVRLITPPGGVVLDPFSGSGSTGKAAIAEGARVILVEREREYCEIARARLERALAQPRLFDAQTVAEAQRQERMW